jgi:hypothetical protein
VRRLSNSQVGEVGKEGIPTTLTCYLPNGMRTFLISYDLRGSEDPDSYERLFEAIRRYHSIEVMYSLWLLRSDRGVSKVLEDLWSALDADDRLLVTDVTGDQMAWFGLDREIGQWIVDNSPAG